MISRMHLQRRHHTYGSPTITVESTDQCKGYARALALYQASGTKSRKEAVCTKPFGYSCCDVQRSEASRGSLEENTYLSLSGQNSDRGVLCGNDTVKRKSF